MPQEADDSPPSFPPEDATLAMTPPTAGGTFRPPSYAPPHEIIGDFELLARLGAGGMGAVYRARQISLERPVALKILPAQFIDDDESVARFQREAQVAASLSHANLIKVHSAGKADGVHYIAMELIDGDDLGRRLKSVGKLLPVEALRICLEVARGLDHAWRTARAIHRDIKPGNIFLAANGAVKVGDLGLAKLLDSVSTGLTQTGAMVGTPHYISPEQARGDREIDFRTDIYSLGCTLYHMLAGETPYRGTDAVSIVRHHLDSPPPAILKAWPQCPVPLARLVSKMVKKSRHERPASYADLIAQIESVWAQIDPVSYNPEAFAPPRPPDPEATLFQTPAPEPKERRFATAGEDGGAGTTAVKNRRSLFIAAGVLALAAVAFVFWPKEEKLTKAQIMMQQRAAEEAARKSAAPAGGTPDLRSPLTPEPWQDALRAPVDIWLSAGVEQTAEGLRFLSRGSVSFRAKSATQRDGAIRARITWDENPLQVQLRVNGGGYYSVCARDAQTITVQNWNNAANTVTVLRRLPAPHPLQPGADYELELRAVGQTLTAKLDGEVLGSVTDAAYSEGYFNLGMYGENASSTLVKSVEVLDLDAPGGASAPAGGTRSGASPTSAGEQGRAGARPSEATKEAPFVNGLGMKFVPVPIVGGPTAGQRVLFSAWDTRVQDYEVFATETRREWPKVDFAQDATHPAVNVSWEDAVAFCAWLTERERKAGKLGANEVYRLPSDHEWSCAVGIGEREDAAKLPNEKSQKIADVFPWGAVWPPPENAGNYWSEELRPALAAGKYSWIKGELPGYHDGFAETSPVGSYAANRFGLYDMGGNVWLWCEDWFDASQQDRVLRGASWLSSDRGNLLSSFRRHYAPGYRYNFDGFRCVVVMSAR